MRKKLTWEQVEARCNMYEEAADHLTMDVHTTNVELEQAEIVQRQIRALSKKFYTEQCKKQCKTTSANQ